MQTMPSSFRKFFRQCAVIIDCSEVFMERPSDLLACAQVWSNYKHHSMVKFLIGIAPQGTISFISKAYGGRISDKKIVEQSSLIDHLLPGEQFHVQFMCYYFTSIIIVGDIILADCGFMCGEYARLAMAEVKTPPFTKGKQQVIGVGNCQLSGST